MSALDPRILGVTVLASSAAFVVVKRWTTGCFVKGRPEGGFAIWLAHVFNLFLLMAVNSSVAILLVARKLDALDPTILDPGRIPLHLGFEMAGLLLALVGNGFMCWALVTMRGHFQVMGKPPRPSDRLLQSGAYGMVRHPMYTSVLCLSLGMALLTQSVALFILFCVHAALILSLVAIEEKLLLRAHGEQFAAYKSRVKRLVPLLY